MTNTIPPPRSWTGFVFFGQILRQGGDEPLPPMDDVVLFDLRKQPAPFVLQLSLSDFYPEYQLNARIERIQEKVRVLSALHGHIQDVFNEHGVQIMSPHYESDPAGPKLVPKERWHEAPARKPEA